MFLILSSFNEKIVQFFFKIRKWWPEMTILKLFIFVLTHIVISLLGLTLTIWFHEFPLSNNFQFPINFWAKELVFYSRYEIRNLEFVKPCCDHYWIMITSIPRKWVFIPAFNHQIIQIFWTKLRYIKSPSIPQKFNQILNFCNFSIGHCKSQMKNFPHKNTKWPNITFFF